MSFDTYDAEPYEVHNEKIVTARKDHKCDACGETIKTGCHYARFFGVHDGNAETVKRCMRCQRLFDHLVERGDGDMYPAQRLDCGESYQDHWGEDPPEEVAALAFALPHEVQPA